MKGTYLLILRLEHELADFAIGRLGRFTLQPGFYLYVGSANGSGGLAARLAYHQKEKRPRWHIDYLRAHAALIETWSVSGPLALEQRWVQSLARAPGLSAPVTGFGASDSSQPSHLFYSPRRPGPRLLTESLVHEISGDADEAPSLTIEITTYDVAQQR